MSNESNARIERAYFHSLPRCTQRAIEHSIAQQLEERTLQAAKRKLVLRRTRPVTQLVTR